MVQPVLVSHISVGIFLVQRSRRVNCVFLVFHLVL